MTSQPNKPFDPASKTPTDPASSSPRDKDVLASPFTIAGDKPAQMPVQKASNGSIAGPSEGYCERVEVGSESQEKAPASRKIAYDSSAEVAKVKAAVPETPAPRKEEPKAAVVPASPPQAAVAPIQTTPSEVPPAPVASAAPAVDTSQLVLRALFGVSHNLDRKEIVERAGKLEGIKNVKEVSQAEIAAMKLLSEGMSKMGFGSQIDLKFTTPEGEVDLLAEQGMTLAVLREGNEYAPGVRETLILIARELSNLS